MIDMIGRKLVSSAFVCIFNEEETWGMRLRVSTILQGALESIETFGRICLIVGTREFYTAFAAK